MSTPLPTQYLPSGLKRIVDYCGWEIMWAIWGQYAGSRLIVPKQVDDAHPLVQLLGMAGARLFCEIFGGEIINVAKADGAKRAIRDKAIRHDKRTGTEMPVLCRRYDLTYRQIQTICREQQPKPALNFDLFESTDF